MIEGFFGFEIFNSKFFWGGGGRVGGGGVGKFGKYFFGWLELRRDFWGVFKIQNLSTQVIAIRFVNSLKRDENFSPAKCKIGVSISIRSLLLSVRTGSMVTK